MTASRRWIPAFERELWPIAAPFAVVVAVGLVTATAGLLMMDAGRAYVTGEGLYSKAQKRAVLHLERYARSSETAEWDAYVSQIAVPQANGRALAALRRDPPDRSAAAEALLAGRNHPDDVPGLIRLFGLAPYMPGMGEAIEIWAEADGAVQRLEDVARTLRTEVTADAPDPARIEALLGRVAAIDAELTGLAERFSETLGAGSRRLRSIVVTAGWGAGLLMLAIGVLASLRTAESLRRRDETFRTMIERAHDVITILDPEGRVVYNSPSVESVLGYRPDELEGHSCLEWIHPDDRGHVVRVLGAATRDAASVEYRFQAKDGRWRTLASHGGPFPLPDGAPGVVVNSRDVTERRQLERRLVEAERMESVGRLAGGVAHDFNNIVSVIAGTVELAREGGEAGPGLQTDLEAIDEACQRAAQLTGQLLTFARREVLEPAVLDANAVVQELAPMLRRLFDDSVELVLDLAPAAVPVRADRAQLDRLVVNLTVNAAEAMPDGGTLTVSTRLVEVDAEPMGASADATRAEDERGEATARGRCVRIDVVDTGVAMSDDVRAHVFEPFFTTKEDGSGLGLATCYGIVRQNGGTIDVEAEPGKGTRFTILWPAADAAALPVVRQAPADATPGEGTILYVEDDPPLRRVVERILARAGYRVLGASDGAEALRLAASEEQIDLLLTDVSMPGMSGRELAERLQESRPDVPVVFMSGYTEDDVLKDRIGARHVHFVSKPFDPDALQARLRDILDAATAGGAPGPDADGADGG